MDKTTKGVIGYRCAFCRVYRMKNDGRLVPVKKPQIDEDGELTLRDTAVLACPDCYKRIRLGAISDED